MSAAGDAIEVLMAQLTEATQRATGDGADIVQSLARRNLAAKTKTGRLERSIEVTGPSPTSADRFEALVGPTVVYGRIHELGGHINPLNHPYFAFYWKGHEAPPILKDGRVLVPHVYQEPQPYLKPAAIIGAKLFREAAIRRWGDAIRSI